MEGFLVSGFSLCVTENLLGILFEIKKSGLHGPRSSNLLDGGAT